jgi:hypothetical protein
MVYPGVVLRVVVHSYRKCDLLARPSRRRTSRVPTSELSHDIGVVCPGALDWVVEATEIEKKGCCPVEDARLPCEARGAWTISAHVHFSIVPCL